ncbi:hypothetical protein FRC08_010167 [Ceratobasidium sp. 394]|nr:hypothetical protein FRC08_010167 [Ceratobasidium sp. 394]
MNALEVLCFFLGRTSAHRSSCWKIIIIISVPGCGTVRPGPVARTNTDAHQRAYILTTPKTETDTSSRDDFINQAQGFPFFTLREGRMALTEIFGLGAEFLLKLLV